VIIFGNGPHLGPIINEIREHFREEVRLDPERSVVIVSPEREV
jgi:hypothetical protein